MPLQFPSSLAGRVALLLAGALIFVNIVAALLLAREGSSFDRLVRLRGDAHRLSALVAALEKTSPEVAQAVIANSSTSFSRFSIGATPLTAGRSVTPDLQKELYALLPDHEVFAAGGLPLHEGDDRPVLMLISVRLTEGHFMGQWLNVLVHPLPAVMAWRWKAGYFTPLIASLLATFAVSIVFIRRMMAPLDDLTRAAHAASRGETGARAAERGTREVRDAASAFNHMQRRITAFNRDRAQLIAAIGHDLRTPITSLRLRVELLDDGRNRDDMIRILDDMAIMADDLRQFSDGVESREEPREMSAAQLLSQMCFDDPRVTFTCPEIRLTVRPVAMRRAVGNLIDNALRYAGSADVEVTAADGRVGIDVRDDGPGIPIEQLDTIRDPFVRGETSRSSETGGTGLGLAIATRIAEDHGGTLSLRNRKPRGLLARIDLPLGGTLAKGEQDG